MIPDDRVELLVARISYAAHVNPQYPLVTLTRKRHSPSGSVTVVRDWFERTVNAEKAQLSPNSILKFAEYRIISGDPELFKAADCRYEKVLLVLGEQFTYWNYHQQDMPLHRHVVGKASLNISFCVCCFHTQYAQVLRTIRKTVKGPIVV